MAGNHSKAKSHHLETLFRLGSAGALTDAQLLEKLALPSDDTSRSAFAVLVERHGSMVLGVCRRVLVDPNDAEDAFQATFLVLFRKAGSIAHRDRLANWLYGVALRTSRASRARKMRRRDVGLQEVAGSAAAPTGAEAIEPDVRAVLDEELSRLPETYRSPVVLCELEGHSRAAAARLLGIPEGTLSSRLARAKERLRDRLTRRGFALSTEVLSTVLAREAKACVPDILIDATLQAELQFTSLKSVGVTIAPAAALAEGVLKAMFLTKMKTITLLVVTLIPVAVAAGLLAQTSPAPPGCGGPDAPSKVASVAGKKTSQAAEPMMNKALAQEQLDLVKKAFADLDRLAAGGEISLSYPGFSLWARRRVDALRERGPARPRSSQRSKNISNS